MAERRPDQIWITRSHLLAIALTTLCIALLSFFLGMRAGRSMAGGGAAVGPPPLVADAARQEQLETLLRKVPGQGGDFSFPKDLPADIPPGSEVLAPTGDVPTEGWAVQVGSFPTADEADARVAELAQKGLKAYRVAAMADGKRWFRVRVGGYANEAEANKAIPDLRALGGAEPLETTAAP